MVTMLDRVSGKALGRVPVGIEPEGVAINADESMAWWCPNRAAWRISSTRRRRR